MTWVHFSYVVFCGDLDFSSYFAALFVDEDGSGAEECSAELPVWWVWVWSEDLGWC